MQVFLCSVISLCMLSLNVGSFFIIHSILCSIVPNAAVHKGNHLLLIPFPSLSDCHPHKQNLHAAYTADFIQNLDSGWLRSEKRQRLKTPS